MFSDPARDMAEHLPGFLVGLPGAEFAPLTLVLAVLGRGALLWRDRRGLALIGCGLIVQLSLLPQL